MSAEVQRIRAIDRDPLLGLDGDVQNVELDPAPVLVTSAHEILETRICVVPGCAGDASQAPAVGPFANRCDACIRAVREKMSRGQRRRQLGVPSEQGNGLPALSIIDAAEQLVPHARRLESALALRRQARADATNVLGEFKAAWQELKAAVDEALA